MKQNNHPYTKQKREREKEKEDYKRDVTTRHRFAIKHAVPGSFLSLNQGRTKDLVLSWFMLRKERDNAKSKTTIKFPCVSIKNTSKNSFPLSSGGRRNKRCGHPVYLLWWPSLVVE